MCYRLAVLAMALPAASARALNRTLRRLLDKKALGAVLGAGYIDCAS